MERGYTRIWRMFADGEKRLPQQTQAAQTEANTFNHPPPSIRVHPPNPCKSASYSSPSHPSRSDGVRRLTTKARRSPRNTKECRKGGAKNQATKPALPDHFLPALFLVRLGALRVLVVRLCRRSGGSLTRGYLLANLQKTGIYLAPNHEHRYSIHAYSKYVNASPSAGRPIPISLRFCY